MKLNNKIRRITSVCAAAALVFMLSVFPITASAEKVTDLQIALNASIYYPTTGNVYVDVTKSVLNNSTYHIESGTEEIPMDYRTRVGLELLFDKEDNSILAFKGESFTINIYNLLYGVWIAGNWYPVDTVDTSSWQLQLNYQDGTVGYFNSGLSWEYNPENETHSISVDVTAEKDVSSIRFKESVSQYSVTGQHGVYYSSVEMGSFDYPLSIIVDIVSKTDEKLDGIGDQIDGIGDQIDDMVNGTPEQNQQVNNSIGDLNNSTDKLDQLGDQMSSVAKPSINSNQISADSLVPHTALVTLASPIQALWENNQLLAMLTIVVTVVLVSWVFFGKKA